MAALGLALFAQPIEHGDAVQILPRCPCSRRMATMAARDRELVGQLKKGQLPKTSGEVQRRRQTCRPAAPKFGRRAR